MKNSSRLFAEIDKKTQSFEQRMMPVVGLGQHPFVEGEPGELSVDKPRARLEGGGTAFDRLRTGVHSALPEKLMRPML